MTKTELKRQLKKRGEAFTDRAIAGIFGVHYQAVQQWPDKGPIPRGRIYELQVKRPELFKGAKT